MRIFVFRRTALLAAVCSLGLWPGRVAAAESELVAIKSVDRTIKIELRYATARNIAGRPIYPSNMPALLRPEVAAQLARAQATLRDKGYGLKVWDAYRPQSAQTLLWQLAPNTDYVADPATGGGSLHTYGVAVDATLVDTRGREVEMPTDFDNFSPQAMLRYLGGDTRIRRNLHALQGALGRAGFYGMRTEWWHFVSKHWQNYKPIPEISIVTANPSARKAARSITQQAEPVLRAPVGTASGIVARARSR